jgi:DnaK suppressor protein
MHRKLSSRDLLAFRKALLGARRVLEDDMDLLEQEALGVNGIETADRIAGDSTGYFQEFNLELLERDGSTLKEIADALERIEAGSYGACERCDQEIGRERLRALPHTRHCIVCRRALESESL